MTLFADAECNNSLMRRYGVHRGYGAPAQIEVALFAGDPRGDGVEMDNVGGYAAALVGNDGTTWPDDAAGRTIVSAPIAFTPTGPWTAGGSSALVTHWATRNHDTGDLMDVMPADEQILVLDADDAFSLQLVVNYVPVIGAS